MEVAAKKKANKHPPKVTLLLFHALGWARGSLANALRKYRISDP